MEAPSTAAAIGDADPAPKPAGPDGVASRRLAGGVLAALPVGEAVLGAGRIVLAPGAALPAHAAVGPELLAVEAGTLEVTTIEGHAWRAQDATESRELESAATLPPGQGVLVESGAVAAYRNAGETPLVLVVATLLPGGAGAATPAPDSGA